MKSIVFLLAFFTGICLQTATAQLPPKRDHHVHLDSAKKFIGNLKKDAMQMKIKGGMFHREIFDKILSQKGCVGIRYYYAKMDDGTPTIVLVGVDSLGNDMSTAAIGEATYPCPPYCADQKTTIDQ